MKWSLTLALGGDVHPVLDLHVSAQVPLQVELAGAVRALEGLAAGVEVHVAQQVVHSVERLPAHLRAETGRKYRLTSRKKKGLSKVPTL